MTWRTTFGTLSAATPQPLSLFDGMFNDVAGMISIPCTASGTNAISLVPLTNAPTLTAYVFYCGFTFIAPATSTGAVTLSFAGLSFLPVYLADGTTAVGSGQIVNGLVYSVQYNPTINAGNGGFFLQQSTISPNPVNVPSGTVTGLTMSCNGTSNNIVWAWNSVTLANATNTAIVTNTGTSGTLVAGGNIGSVNGSEQATVANTWYYIFIISNGGTFGLWSSINASGGVFPAGYVYRKYVGAFATDGTGSHFPLSFVSKQQFFQYQVSTGSNVASMPLLAAFTGAKGAPGTPTWNPGAVVGVSGGGNAIVGSISPTAIRFLGTAGINSASSGVLIVAPNNSYGPYQSPTNPPPYYFFTSVAAVGLNMIDMVLESGNVYYAATTSACACYTRGWVEAF